jgi:DNA-binding NtrC family response regulator
MDSSPRSEGGAAQGAQLQTLGALRSVCASMHRLFGHVRNIAQSDAAVLLLGESGVGKELLARTLHELSPRRGRRLVVLVCTGLSAARLSAALYGEEPPAILKRPARLPATAAPPQGPEGRRPATGRHSGALAQASGGTLLLDDVAALDAEGQSELLRAVNSEPSLLRLSSRRGPRLRLLSTSTEDIAKAVRLGRFRPDLYHRLAAARLEVPPLRERRGDVALLAGELLAAAAAHHRRPLPTLHPEALALLAGYPFPGNLRELRDVMELALLHSRGPVLRAADLVELLYAVPVPPRVEIPLGWTLAAAEREVILQTLAAHRGNRQETADTLAISRRTLYEKLARYKAQDGTALRAGRRPPRRRQAARAAPEPGC